MTLSHAPFYITLNYQQNAHCDYKNISADFWFEFYSPLHNKDIVDNHLTRSTKYKFLHQVNNITTLLKSC